MSSNRRTFLKQIAAAAAAVPMLSRQGSTAAEAVETIPEIDIALTESVAHLAPDARKIDPKYLDCPFPPEPGYEDWETTPVTGSDWISIGNGYELEVEDPKTRAALHALDGFTGFNHEVEQEDIEIRTCLDMVRHLPGMRTEKIRLTGVQSDQRHSAWLDDFHKVAHSSVKVHRLRDDRETSWDGTLIARSVEVDFCGAPCTHLKVELEIQLFKGVETDFAK